MQKSNSVFLISITLILLLGCSKDENPTNTPNTTPKHFYPLKVGNTWSYSNGDIITIISTDIADNGATAYLIDGDDDYTFGERALFYDGNKLYGYELSIRTIELLLDEDSVSTSPESITVPAGTFNANKYNRPNTDITYWMVKGIGVVRRDRGSDSRVLVAYTLK